MVTLLIAGGAAFGVPVRRARDLRPGGTSARNEVRCWIASATSQRKRFSRAQQHSFLTSEAAGILPTRGATTG